MPDEETVASLARRQLAVKIAAAYLRRNQLDASQIASLISTVHQTIGHLGKAPEEATERTPAVPVRRSIHHEYVVCLECGWKGQVLRSHLTTRHALSPAAYRARWHLPHDHRLTAAAYSERRSTLAKQLGLGRRAAPVGVTVPAAPSVPKRRGRPRTAPKS